MTQHTETLGSLKEQGGKIIMKHGYTVEMPDGAMWEEQPSDNGNGWFAGDINNIDNLVMIPKEGKE